MNTTTTKPAVVFNLVLMGVGAFFLLQSILGIHILPTEDLARFLGFPVYLSGIWAYFFLFVAFWIGSVPFFVFVELLEKKVLPHNLQYQRRANSLAKSFLVSFITLFVATLVTAFLFADRDALISSYLFSFFFFNGLLGWAGVRVVTDQKEKERISGILNRWQVGEIGFWQMIRRLKEVNQVNRRKRSQRFGK